MQIVQNKVSVNELQELASKMFGNLVKAVVDIEKEILVIDAELHADQEQFLIQEGSRQSNLWGINLHPDHYDTDKFIEFDSMINIRPNQNNPTRGINDVEIQKRIRNIVNQKVIK
jgi:hypothetical protein